MKSVKKGIQRKIPLDLASAIWWWAYNHYRSIEVAINKDRLDGSIHHNVMHKLNDI